MSSVTTGYEVGGIQVIHQKIKGFEPDGANYNGFNPSTTILPKGHLKEPGRRSFPLPVVWDRDVEIPTRDGTVLRADIFRPSDVDHRIPALVAYAPFGKSGTGK